MSPRLMLLAGVLSLAACAAAAQPEPIVAHAPMAGLACEVRALATPHGVALEAVAYADAPLLGEYEFTITKDDSGGASDIAATGTAPSSN